MKNIYMRFNYNEVNFEATYEGHQMWLKTHFMNILIVLMNIIVNLKTDWILLCQIFPLSLGRNVFSEFNENIQWIKLYTTVWK